MIRKLKSIPTTISTGAILLALSSLVSRILGMFRDRIFASNFGAGELLDNYFAAFRLPDFIFNLLILGALSSSFIPIFTEYLSKNKKEQAFKLANSLLNITILLLLSISIILFFLAPYFTDIIAPGFSPENKQITSNLTRIMLLSPIFFCLSNIASGILNSFKKFLAYSLAPIFYNLSIIVCTILFIDKIGIYSLAVGVVIGSFLHFMVQLPSIIKTGFKYRPVFSLAHEGLTRIIKLMIPRTLGLATSQINLWVTTVVASTLTLGSVSIYNLSNNLQSVPLGLFGISFAVSVFPFLSESASRKDEKKFLEHLSSAFIKILLFTLPTSLLMILLRAQIVRLILGTGNFDWEDTILTANSLGIFCISLFAQALIPLFSRAFYSLQDTKTPVIISISSVIINIILSLVLSYYFDIIGLPLAFTISSIINMILLLIFLKIRLGDIQDNIIISNTIKIIIISIISVSAGFLFTRIIAPLVDMQSFLGILIQTSITVILCYTIFFTLAYIFKFKEIKKIISTISSTFRIGKKHETH